MALLAAGLPVRDCKICHVRDDHPRCHEGAWGPVPIDSLPIAHMDCHAATGCPLCAYRMATAGARRGAELREYLAAHPLSDELIAELKGQPLPPETTRGERLARKLLRLPPEVLAEALAHINTIKEG